MLLLKMNYSDSFLLFTGCSTQYTSQNVKNLLFILSFVIYVSYINSIAVSCYNSFSKYCLQMDMIYLHLVLQPYIFYTYKMKH
jgi:hypothetical protein